MRIVIEIDPAPGGGETGAQTPAAEPSAELLSRATALNAQNAGPAPSLAAAPTLAAAAPGPVAPASTPSLVTQADTPAAGFEPAAEISALAPCPSRVAHDGGAANAGPAPL
jgi:hypothetical protein